MQSVGKIYKEKAESSFVFNKSIVPSAKQLSFVSSVLKELDKEELENKEPIAEIFETEDSFVFSKLSGELPKKHYNDMLSALNKVYGNHKK